MPLSEAVQSYLDDTIRSLAPTRIIEFADGSRERSPLLPGPADVIHVDFNTHTAASAVQIHGTPEVALILDAPSRLKQREVERLLAGLRNTGVATIIAISARDTATHCEPWRIAHYIGLGFRRAQGSRTLSHTHVVYRYDIHDYKLTPGWLNARNWANPGAWDKQRW